MIRGRLIVAVILAIAAPGLFPATSGGAEPYRQGEPAVMTPPAAKPKADRNDEAKTVKAFQDLYESKGKPRIVLFWNKELSDQLSDFTTVARISNYTQQSVTEKQSGGDPKTAGLGKETTAFARNDTNIDVRTEPQRRPQLGPLANQRMEGAFTGSFRDAKIHFLDRDLLMRLDENQQRKTNAVDQSIDSKATEIAAVSERADILFQVGMVCDPSTRAGMAYQIQVSDLKTGAVYAQFVARDAGGVPDKTRWQAGESGYEQVTIPGYADFTQSGHALALKTMEELLKSW